MAQPLLNLEFFFGLRNPQREGLYLLVVRTICLVTTCTLYGRLSEGSGEKYGRLSEGFGERVWAFER